MVLAHSFSHSVNFALDGDCGLQRHKVGSRVVTPQEVHAQRPIIKVGTVETHGENQLDSLALRCLVN